LVLIPCCSPDQLEDPESDDIFDYDTLEGSGPGWTSLLDPGPVPLLSREQLLARILQQQQSRIPQQLIQVPGWKFNRFDIALQDLLEDEAMEEGEGEGGLPPSPQSKEAEGCVVHYHYHYHN
jgi:hypothetical protein